MTKSQHSIGTGLINMIWLFHSASDSSSSEEEEESVTIEDEAERRR